MWHNFYSVWSMRKIEWLETLWNLTTKGRRVLRSALCHLPMFGSDIGKLVGFIWFVRVNTARLNSHTQEIKFRISKIFCEFTNYWAAHLTNHHSFHGFLQNVTLKTSETSLLPKCLSVKRLFLECVPQLHGSVLPSSKPSVCTGVGVLLDLT